MNNILNNTHYQKLNIGINNNQNAYKIDKLYENSNDNIQNTTSTDKIVLIDKNEIAINTQKAHDAFKDTCSDYGFMDTSNGSSDMSLWYCISVALMKDKGISVPSFSPNDTTNTSFLTAIDQIKEFSKNIPSSYNFPNNFLDFCDSYKEKLIQYDCK